MANQKEIWRRIEPSGKKPGETAQAYEAAKLYFELAADRSLEAVGQKLGKSKTLMERWSRQWRWVERAKAYDLYVESNREVNLQRQRAEDAEKWLERDRQLREEFYQAGEQFVTKAKKLLSAFPDKGQASLSGIAQIMSTGAELQRLAVGIQPGSTPLDNLDLDSLSREDLLKLLKGEPIKLRDDK